ncbi:MAG: hypothetical protein LBH51_02655 [Treponema sp.]|nr:hypothetical protein [Treponema sp.]
MPDKITMGKAVVEIDGDEMTRVLWALIKERLILPYVDPKTEYYDLGLENRDATDDRVSAESVRAIHRMGLAEMKGPGIVQGIHNLDDSIRSFARSCFLYALDAGLPIWFAAKDTISKTYDGRFKEIFGEVYEGEFKEKCEAAGISYFYTLIDDAVARVIRGEGGCLWACKHSDGDVMRAMVASVLVSPSGAVEYEAAHGTVQQHYYRWKKGEKTSTNPVALIFAWTRDLARLAGTAPGRILDSWEFVDAIARRL